MTARAEPGPLELVVLTEEEVVLRGGSGTTTWLVPYHDGTLRPQRHPRAKVEQLERGPGIVWRTRIELTLPRGSVLTRVHSRPSDERRSALAHLTSGAKGSMQRTTRTRFRVGVGGKLEDERLAEGENRKAGRREDGPKGGPTK